MSIRLVSLTRALVCAAALLAPSVAGAVATNLTLTTPAGPAVKTQVIVLDASTGKQVEEKDTDDRGAVYFDLPEGSYRVRTSSGESKPFTVRKPGPVALTLPLAGGAAAATGGAAATSTGWKPWPVWVDAELGFNYLAGGDVDMTSEITSPFITAQGLTTESRSSDYTQYGAVLLGRIHLPLSTVLGDPDCGSSLFVQAGGVLGQDKNLSGARFGIPGTTGLAHSDARYEGGWEFGAGVRVPVQLNGSEIGFSPWGGYAWDDYQYFLRYDETAFNFPLQIENKTRSVGSAIAGLNIDFVPCRDECGLFLGLGGGYKFAVDGDKTSIEANTPGGFPGAATFEVDDAWFMRASIGYRFGQVPLFK